MTTPLVLASNRVNAQPQADAPRTDYLEIARALDGELLGYDLSDSAWYSRARHVETKLKLDLVEAWTAARRSRRHSAIVSLSEKVALPLAVLLRARKRVPHIVIGHKLSSGLKTRVLRGLKLHERFDQLVCVSRAQAEYAIHHLGMPADRVHFVHNNVDHVFFRPRPDVREGDYILAVGREQRDYQTLLEAVRDTGIRLIVVASSPWSTSAIDVTSGQVRVEVRSRIPFKDLRELYAGARMIVVPLFDVDYAAGANAALEAMAMGKPLIITRTAGIEEYVVPGETGRHVAPGNAEELRSAIQALWSAPDERQRLGANARQAVDAGMNLDQYVKRVVEIVRSVS